MLANFLGQFLVLDQSQRPPRSARAGASMLTMRVILSISARSGPRPFLKSQRPTCTRGKGKADVRTTAPITGCTRRTPVALSMALSGRASILLILAWGPYLRQPGGAPHLPEEAYRHPPVDRSAHALFPSLCTGLTFRLGELEGNTARNRFNPKRTVIS